MKKNLIVLLLILTIVLVAGCTNDATSSKDLEMYISPITYNDQKENAFEEAEVKGNKLYHYSVIDNVKSIVINVYDYSDKKNSNKLIDSHVIELKQDTIKGNILIKHNFNEEDINFIIKSNNLQFEATTKIDISNLPGMQVFLPETSEIKIGKPIAINAVLYGESFDSNIIENYLERPELFDEYDNAYYITMTFYDK